MNKLQITHNGSEADVECVLEKAVSSMKLQREKKELSIPYLLHSKTNADHVVNEIFTHMIDDIAHIITRRD